MKKLKDFDSVDSILANLSAIPNMFNSDYQSDYAYINSGTVTVNPMQELDIKIVELQTIQGDIAAKVNEIHAVQTGEFYKLIAKQNSPTRLTAKQKQRAEEKAKEVEMEMKIEALRNRKFNKILNKPISD